MKKYLLNKKTSFLQRVVTMLAVLFVAIPAVAQTTTQSAAGTVTVSGVVSDKSGQPLVGATVMIAGTNKAVTTDIRGKYTIKVEPKNVLEFRFIGYTSQKISVGSKTTINVTLAEDQQAIEELVVIGYGSVKKNDVTGSVATVKMQDVADVPVISIDQALQGRIAGADFMSTSGEPGATTTIRIRGTRSITATNEPLIVVDGVIDGVNDLNDINPADIESVNILKDASSTAIYGSRGSNGVILITTKQGREGKTNVSLRADVGFSQLPRGLDIMNATEFARYRNDYAFHTTADGNDQIGSDTPLTEYPYPNPNQYGKGTNWIDEITRTAPYQNYTLSVSGGTKSSSYFGSFGYLDSRGIIDNSGMKRYTGRLNIDKTFTKWLKVGLKLGYTYNDNDNNLATIGGTNWWNAAMFLNPLLKPNTNWNDLWYGGQKFNSPLATVELNTNNSRSSALSASGYIEVKPWQHLTIRSQATYYDRASHSFQYQPGSLPAKSEDEGGYAYRAEGNSYNLLSENTVTYNNDFGKHHVDAMVGFTAQVYNSNSFSLSGKGYMQDALLWNNMGAIPDKLNLSPSTSSDKKVRESIVARANYNYKQKYYVTFTGRYDTASFFAKNKKGAFFPSAALKWNISNEEFAKNAGWLSDLSLRLSAGRTGNDGISTYRSLAAMGYSTGGYLFGGTQPVAFYRSRLGSDDLSWETSDMYTAAIDLGLLKDKLRITFEGYLTYTKDLLLTVQRPTHTGFSSEFLNVGKTSNKGIELTIESYNINKRDFTWSTTFTFAHNEQKVNDIGSEDFVSVMDSYGNTKYMMYGYVEGYPLNSLWGFVYAGTWKNADEVSRNKITKAYASAYTSPGCPRYLDINHDGVLNDQDLVYMGNADPWLYGGLQNTFKYKNLTVGFYFNYSLGGKIYNVAETFMGNNQQYVNQYRYMQNAWHPVRNPNSDIPRPGSYDGIASDRMVHDATFLRLKNISVQYRFDLAQKTNNILRDITLGVSGDNLYLWKKYNGFDPEVSSSGTSSTLRRADVGAYPKPRTIIFSVQLRY